MNKCTSAILRESPRQIVSDTDWQAAFHWLVRQRRRYPASAGVWDLWWRWSHPVFRMEEQLYQQVTSCRYRLSPLHIVSGADDDGRVVWSARDALVLKWVALKLRDRLPLHSACAHVKGHGGVSAYRLSVYRKLAAGPLFDQGYVFRTDIRGYYQHMNKTRLYQHLSEHNTDAMLLILLRQYLDCQIEVGGEFFTPQGLCRGSALSPLIGGSLLYDMDCAMSALQKQGVFYTRYMDDMLILAPLAGQCVGRWTMRRARTVLLQHFDEAGFEMHPDKTQVGRLPRVGFDWLGGEFCSGRVTVAPRALANWREAYHRRSQSMKRKSISDVVRRKRLRDYCLRWRRWLALPPPGSNGGWPV